MTERKKTHFVTAILLIPLFSIYPSLSLASLVFPEWQFSVQRNEPKLADVYSSGRKAMPDIQDYEGLPRMDFVKATQEALRKQREPNVQKTELILGRLSAACSAESPEWDVVWLCLAAAYYAPPSSKLCQTAAQIVKSPPASPFAAETVMAAMRLLVASGQKQYIQVVYDCVALDAFADQNRGKVGFDEVRRHALGFLAELPPADAKAYLVSLTSKYPYDVPIAQTLHPTPDQIMGWGLNYVLREVNDALNGALIMESNKPSP